MSHVDHLLATRTPLELAKLLAATARDNAALRDRVGALEHELFWSRVGAWISCSERLPDIGTEVLVLRPKSERGTVTALARFIPYEESPTFYWANVYGRSNMHLAESVTHWQPMPRGIVSY